MKTVKTKLVWVDELPHKCPQCGSTANWMTVGVETMPNNTTKVIATRCNGCGNYYAVKPTVPEPVNTDIAPWHFDINKNKIVQLKLIPDNSIVWSKQPPI